MTHRLLYNPHHHALSSFLLLVEALWRDPTPLPALDIDIASLDTSLMRFRPTAEETAAVRQTLREATGHDDPRPLVLLNANASDLIPLRKWADDRYAELARRLLAEDPELFVAFTGSPSEAKAIDAVVQTVNHRRCFSLAGKTTMRQLLDILTLVGPETPKVWGVLGPRAHRVSIDLPCSPCVSIYNNRLSSCRNNLCMQGITVEMVHRKVKELLGQR
jgi:ADP-heptose:LPS heptosyltransferase